MCPSAGSRCAGRGELRPKRCSARPRRAVAAISVRQPPGSRRRPRRRSSSNSRRSARAGDRRDERRGGGEGRLALRDDRVRQRVQPATTPPQGGPQPATTGAHPGAVRSDAGDRTRRRQLDGRTRAPSRRQPVRHLLGAGEGGDLAAAREGRDPRLHRHEGARDHARGAREARVLVAQGHALERVGAAWQLRQGIHVRSTPACSSRPR